MSAAAAGSRAESPSSGADRPALAALEAEYEILNELGRGGMAVVFRARDRVLGREVAIKLVSTRWVEDREVLARFEREARLAARLEHPNIVRIYTVRQLPGAALALVMQYIPGVTLKEEVQRSGPLPVDRVERVLREICSALACAHARGVIHRDVKPENIFIDARDGTALLADFGVARPLTADTRLTVGGMAMGTPAYMSPEQIDDGSIDARSDLYSLGLVAWEMLAGRAPWAGESLYSVLHMQKTAELPSLGRLRPDVPVPLRTAIERSIRKAPAARWPSAQEFLEALARPPEARWRAWTRAAVERIRGAAASRAPHPAALPVADGAAEGATVVYRRAEDPADPPAPAPPVGAASEAGGAAGRESGSGEERRRLGEWLELRAMMERRTLDHAGPGQHPRWALYPCGPSDHALLREVGAVSDAEARLLMETYGAVDVLLADTAVGVEARTRGGLRTGEAEMLLDRLRSLR